MGETQTPHFFAFGIFGRVPEPQNQYDLSLEKPGHLNKSKKPQIIFENYYLYTFQNFAFRTILLFWQRRAPTNPGDPCNTILKILDMRPISINKNMKWKLGNMGSLNL